MSVSSCRPWSARHRFDPASGWCAHGCGVRDDGLVASARTGKVIAAPSRRPGNAAITADRRATVPPAPLGASRTHRQSHAVDAIDITEPRRGRDD